MIEEILPGFYHIQLPYTGSPLRNINVYVVKTAEKSLMIDSGAALEECRKVLTSGLSQLGLDLRKTDFFITHGHRDHITSELP